MVYARRCLFLSLEILVSTVRFENAQRFTVVVKLVVQILPWDLAIVEIRAIQEFRIYFIDRKYN